MPAQAPAEQAAGLLTKNAAAASPHSAGTGAAAVPVAVAAKTAAAAPAGKGAVLLTAATTSALPSLVKSLPALVAPHAAAAFGLVAGALGALAVVEVSRARAERRARMQENAAPADEESVEW